MSALRENDLEILHMQLGRVPRGVLAVEARCPEGHPQVIKVYPLLRDGDTAEPFPTLFWLTCPKLIEQIAALEHHGWIQKLESLLQEDEGFLQAYHNNHRQYLDERWQTLSEQDQQWLIEKGWHTNYQKKGIGGIANWDSLKCLHLQFAHHLARENVIGKWLDDHSELIRCL